MTASATPVPAPAAEPSVRPSTLRLLRTLFGESSDGVLALHGNGCRVYSNPALDALVTTDARRPIGTAAPPSYIPPEQHREYWRMLGETSYVLTSGQWSSTQLELVGRDGHPLVVELTIFPFAVVDGSPLAVWLFRVATAPGAQQPVVVHSPDFAVLTRREQEVLDQLLAGRRVASIARHLYVSEHTVRNHLKSIFRKLRAHSQAELIDRYSVL